MDVGLEDVVDIMIFLVDMVDFCVYNVVYVEFFNYVIGFICIIVVVWQFFYFNLLIEIKVVVYKLFV